MVNLESRGDGEAQGSRSMARRIRETHEVLVTRDAVSAAQLTINPDDVAGRRKHRLQRRDYHVPGPNALWHFDQNDKLRQFGFEIHGCIDGWSRKMIWLHVTPNNRIPELVLAYYIDAVLNVDCLPALQRSDRGAENTLAAAVQQHFNGASAHLFGRSVANQRIESWWNQMYAGGIHFWIKFFKNLWKGPETTM
uniref:Integrase core domain-containing protein n=1 Tax=Spongospora subterranea TaxID=70186 RepID=A0A0H5QHS4_9EUKA|eukprot:CRZ01202.1 hypothetical protein [Spongospora subterranea]